MVCKRNGAGRTYKAFQLVVYHLGARAASEDNKGQGRLASSLHENRLCTEEHAMQTQVQLLLPLKVEEQV